MDWSRDTTKRLSTQYLSLHKVLEADGMKKLPEVDYAYNTAIQESSRHTPYRAMFGRQIKLPIEEDYDPAKKLQQHLCGQDPPGEVMEMNKKKNRSQREEKQKQHEII